jgi:hypothetical protein
MAKQGITSCRTFMPPQSFMKEAQEKIRIEEMISPLSILDHAQSVSQVVHVIIQQPLFL